jgi:thiol-disulfide isomerase/thioredoxin
MVCKCVCCLLNLIRCGPCKQFTPILAQFYNDMKKKGKRFEIIWISRDRSDDEFIDYYKDMPWLAVPLENIATVVEATSEKYNVRGIPHLVILDAEDASVLTLEGVSKVRADAYGLEFPWRPRTPMAMYKTVVPRFARKIVAAQLQNAKRALLNALHVLLQSLAPTKLFNNARSFISKFI